MSMAEEKSEINRIQDQIISEISALDEWTDVYQYLISLGRDLEIPDEHFRKDENLISGCQSKLWLDSRLENRKVVYSAASDTVIIMGILALILKVLNNREPAKIVNADLYFLEKTGLYQHLSPVRSNGLAQVVWNIKEKAREYT